MTKENIKTAILFFLILGLIVLSIILYNLNNKIELIEWHLRNIYEFIIILLIKLYHLNPQIED